LSANLMHLFAKTTAASSHGKRLFSSEQSPRLGRSVRDGISSIPSLSKAVIPHRDTDGQNAEARTRSTTCLLPSKHMVEKSPDFMSENADTVS